VTSQKKKILIVISSDEYIRNYIQNSSFQATEREFDCYYIGSDSLTKKTELQKKIGFKGFYKEDLEKNRKSYNYFNVLMYKYRSKSTSFVFRIKRTLDPPRIGFKGIAKLIFYKKFNKIFGLVKIVLKKLKVQIFASYLIFPWFRKKFEKNYKINSEVSVFVNDIKPEIILFPSSAYDPIGVDIVKLARQYKCKSFFLIDNWDNLSSKSILWEKPDYLGVWSQQSVEHAIGIQQFNKSRVFILGAPRFNNYFQTRDKTLLSYFPFKYILFVGTAVEFDEAGALVKTNQIIEDNPQYFKDVKIVYRPHPWRQGKDTISDKNLKHVILDPQLEQAYLMRNTGVSVQPCLDYYPSLIKNAEFVMGGLTSMIIEALIFRKSFLALAYNDGNYLTSQHNMLKYYVHFKGLENVSAIKFCLDPNYLQQQLIVQWEDRNKVDSQLTDNQREFFLFQDAVKSYGEQLNSTMKKIITLNLIH
jgi:hypothetical protein